MKALHSKIELAVSKDTSRPQIGHVHLDVDKSRLLATNGHIAAIVPVQLDSGDTSGPISIDAIKQARKEDKRSGDYHIRANGGLELSNGAMLPRESDVQQFPDIDRVINPNGEPVVSVSFNAKLLYELAQALGTTNRGQHQVTLEIRDENNVILVTARGCEAHGAIMPMRR